jgi:hypothetical protein
MAKTAAARRILHGAQIVRNSTLDNYDHTHVIKCVWGLLDGAESAYKAAWAAGKMFSA